MMIAAAVNLTTKIHAGGIEFVTSLTMTNELPQIMVAAMMSKR